MKYRVKDYEDIRAWVDNMTEEELLTSVTCPNVSPEKPDIYHGVSAIFFHTNKLLKAGMDKFAEDEKKPLIVADMEGKFVSMRACANSGDDTLAYEMGKYKAGEARIEGYHWGLGPCVDITGNPDCPIVTNRTPGRTVEENIRYGTQFILGMQEHGIIATAKHFPGDGYCAYDQHLTTTENPLPFDEWMNTFGCSYKAFIEAGVRSIMPGHISLPSYDDIDEETGICRPATLSKKLMTDLLKKELGFEGIIITDALNMGGFAGYINLYRGYAESLEAGADLLLFAHPDEIYMNEMHKLIEEGVLTIETLKNRAYRMWCFAKEHTEDAKYKEVDMNKEKMDDVAYRLAKSAPCIERNRRNVLPLKLNTQSKVLVNCIINPNEPHDVEREKRTADKLTEKLKEKVGAVDVIDDAGPDEEVRMIRENNYDAVICYVTTTPSYGTNSARLSGTIARNMMGGWYRLGTPVVFITSVPGIKKEYESCMDALINTNGSGRDATIDTILEMIMGSD